MRHASVRGFGIRYFLGLTLPITGIALVIYTAIQLILAHSSGGGVQRPVMVRASAVGAPAEPAPGAAAAPAGDAVDREPRSSAPEPGQAGPPHASRSHQR